MKYSVCVCVCNYCVQSRVYVYVYVYVRIVCVYWCTPLGSCDSFSSDACKSLTLFFRTSVRIREYQYVYVNIFLL